MWTLFSLRVIITTMRLRKVISGAQTGADIAGLEVAKKFGLETGGSMPFGYKTLDGPKTEYREMYGVEMHQSSSYVPRTRHNVKDSDGTIRLASNFDSRGEVCTLRAIQDYKKPHFDVDLSRLSDLTGVASPTDLIGQQVVEWLDEHDIEVLNVAGNAEQTSPGTHARATEFLTELFQRMGLPCDGSQCPSEQSDGSPE